MKYIFNKVGVTLLETTISLSVLGIFFSSMLIINNKQKVSIESTVVQSEESDVVWNILRALTKYSYCKGSFVDTNFVLGNPVSEIKHPNGHILFSSGNTFANGKVLIKSMQLNNLTIPPSGGYGEVDFIVTMARLKDSIEVKETTFNHKIVMSADSSMVVTSCHTSIINAALTIQIILCNGLGGTLNPGTLKCDISSSCNTTNIATNQAVSTTCLNNEFIPNYFNNYYLRTDGGTIDTDFNINSTFEFSTTGPTPPALLTANSLNLTNALTVESLLADTTLTLDGKDVATINDLFNSLSEANKEAILNEIITNTTSSAGTNAIVSKFRESISVSNTCPSGQFINSISFNNSTGTFSLSCFSLY